MYEAAGERLGDKAFLTLGRAEKLPYDENKFDVIITTDTCYFWDEPDKVLAEIFRTLKDKGIFVNSYNTMYVSIFPDCYKYVFSINFQENNRRS